MIDRVRYEKWTLDGIHYESKTYQELGDDEIVHHRITKPKHFDRDANPTSRSGYFYSIKDDDDWEKYHNHATMLSCPLCGELQ